MKLSHAVLGGALATSAGMASAAVDVTAITAALGEAGTAIGLVAAAMLLVAGAGIAIKWVLGFIF